MMPKPVRKPARKPKPKAKHLKPKWKLYQGDCLKVMRDMPDECVHTTVTSPPYWALRDYEHDEQHGSEDSLEEWLRVQVEVFEQVRRITRPDGTLWVNIGDNYVDGELVGQPWRLALALKDAGWILRADCIWAKPNPTPEPGGRRRPTLAHEYIFLFAKTRSYYYDEEAVREKSITKPRTYTRGPQQRHRNGDLKPDRIKPETLPTRGLRSVWSIPAGGKGAEGHFAAFPEKLPEICIKAGTSERGCCEVCGAPYVREMELTELGKKLLGKGWHDHEKDESRGQRTGGAKAVSQPLRVTKGWKPGCDCGLGVAPCRVFDPYAGGGTTGEVALALGRSFSGIELTDKWYQLARKHLAAGSSRGGQVTDDDLKVRAELGMMSDLEKKMFRA